MQNRNERTEQKFKRRFKTEADADDDGDDERQETEVEGQKRISSYAQVCTGAGGKEKLPLLDYEYSTTGHFLDCLN